MTTVLIADDHRLFAQTLERIINIKNDIKVIGVAATLEQTRSMISQICPDIILLDIALPDGDGIDAINELRTLCPTAKIAVLTMYAEGAVINRAIKAGADGYVLKNVDINELFAAIGTLSEGERYFCNEARQILSNRDFTDIVDLTAREKEVLSLIAEGLTEREIANKLYLSFETVHSYAKYLRHKLCCTNNASLVRTALRLHLV